MNHNEPQNFAIQSQSSMVHCDFHIIVMIFYQNNKKKKYSDIEKDNEPEPKKHKKSTHVQPCVGTRTIRCDDPTQRNYITPVTMKGVILLCGCQMDLDQFTD
jgi:hypothetical protein